MKYTNYREKNFYKKDKGITVLALILTITVLLILACVTIDIIIDDSVIDKAKDVEDKANEHSETIESIRDEIRNQIRPDVP